jgi:hypothetical protein
MASRWLRRNASHFCPDHPGAGSAANSARRSSRRARSRASAAHPVYGNRLRFPALANRSLDRIFSTYVCTSLGGTPDDSKVCDVFPGMVENQRFDKLHTVRCVYPF